MFNHSSVIEAHLTSLKISSMTLTYHTLQSRKVLSGRHQLPKCLNFVVIDADIKLLVIVL